MGAKKRLSRGALLFVAAFAVAPRVALAQQWLCYPFGSGETAAGAARRIAGDANYRDYERFRIFDPAASRFLARGRYDRIRPGWLACTRNTRAAQASIAVTPSTGPASAQSGTAHALPEIRLDPLWYLVVLLLLTSFGLHRVGRRWKQRRAAIGAMTQFGKFVIDEFERPLTQSRDEVPALRSRLRVKPQRRRLEVLLAPGAGRSYPNLSDHRANVEYDMERVRHALGDEWFVSDSMRQRGEWVVLSFRARIHQKQAGVT